MSDDRSIEFFDLLVFLTQRRKFFLLLLVGSFVLAYAGIYLFVEDQYESTATIVSSEEQNGGMFSSLLRTFESLPAGLGATAGKSENKFNTMLYSRSSMEEAIQKHHLYAAYNLDSTDARDREKALTKLRKNVKTHETEEMAFQITASARSPQLAADLTNTLVDVLNRRIIALKALKSHENRLFLEQRVREITEELRASEDSLKVYQEESGMLEAVSQTKEILSVYAKLEAELDAKQLQLGILETIYDKDSPQVKALRMEIAEYGKKLDNMRAEAQPGSVILALNSLPKASIEYLRRFRKVEIGNAVLKYVIPLFEQSKIDEKKDIPIIQVVESAVPPTKRSYPPRVLFSAGIALSAFLFALLALFVADRIESSTNEKIRYLRENYAFRRKRGT